MKGATYVRAFFGVCNDISIRAPNEGSDCEIICNVLRIDISIRAPNEGSDCASAGYRKWSLYFNPRSQ